MKKKAKQAKHVRTAEALVRDLLLSMVYGLRNLKIHAGISFSIFMILVYI